MMEIVGLFKERNTVDDLGIGSVRDTLSDLLFPGTSTLHTRARYLLFLPWICLDIERASIPSRNGWDALKEREVALIFALLRGGETTGVIGREARERLKNFPSFMYWSALGQHGMRLHPVSRGQYIDGLDAFHAASSRRVATGDLDGEPDRRQRNWHAGLPTAPDGMLEQVTFTLDTTESEYLTERILANGAGSYYAHLLTSPLAAAVEAPWLHPAAIDAPTEAAETLEHAWTFSDVIHGAALFYNLLLAEAVHEARTQGGTLEADDGRERYRAALDEWAVRIEGRGAAITGWDEPHFWHMVTGANRRVPGATTSFVQTWTRAVLELGPRDVVADPRIRALIRRRELQMKGKLARLHNPRSLERWSGFAGADQLTFRWGQVQQTVADIVEPRAAVGGA
jgi:hypothetical protein